MPPPRYLHATIEELAKVAKLCTYCGSLASTKEHVKPDALCRTGKRKRWAPGKTVPACFECNVIILNDIPLLTIEAKAEYIYNWLLENRPYESERISWAAHVARVEWDPDWTTKPSPERIDDDEDELAIENGVRDPWGWGLGKRYSQKQAIPRVRMISFRQVASAIGKSGKYRDQIMVTFKSLGGNVDRWRNADKRAMAEAITQAEDALELAVEGRMTESRRALRATRRQLELETT